MRYMSVLRVLSSHPAPFMIYGAQVVAYGAYCAIAHLCGRKPEAFLVSEREGNPAEIDGIPVRTIDEVSSGTLVIVGVTELLQKEIIASLEAKGYRHYVLLTQHEEHLLMSAYFSSIGKFPNAEERLGEGTEADLAIYAVRNHRDKLLEAPPALEAYEIPIQAGAALTQQRIAALTDDTGESISHKNKQYCELTATYWVWKNTHHDWTGIEHYRRRLLVRPEMLQDSVDAILPLPYLCSPNTVSQFRRFVSEDVLQALLRALQKVHPAEYEEYHAILFGPYQYTYNLLCARRKVFEDYCSWFFEITECLEQMAETVPELKTTRALSYVAEVLTNLYFMSQQERWKIRHVEKGIYT